MLYPNDPRYTEVEDLQVSNKLQGVLNRLKTQSDSESLNWPIRRKLHERTLDRDEPTRAAGAY